MRCESAVVLGALGGFSLVGCEGGRAEAASVVTPPHNRRSASKRGFETRQKAEPTAELIAGSEKLLADHADAPIGSQFPLSVGGARYVARIEEHDNPGNEPGRPPGKHKGVTVYKP
ncbi:MAG TPA: hypothetical protein VEX18_08450 [Polyangiaceae bacterium]|nr:hypothetical protein [Polyangiaceae bacterium]